MNNFKVILAIAVLVLASVGAMGQNNSNYAKLESKAKSFVQIEEWNSANAMFILMVEQRENDAKPYAGAIVTAGVLNNENVQLDMLERTQKRGIAMDSIFNAVHDFAFSIGQSGEYEKFLKLVKSRNQWISRHINIRLLKYYDFRNDAPNMVAVGNELLATTPNDIEDLSVVARGYMIMADYENAVNTYKRILELNSNDYNSLIALGNYYYVMWKSAEGTRAQFTQIRTDALNYLSKAYESQPTPFLAKMIDELKTE